MHLDIYMAMILIMKKKEKIIVYYAKGPGKVATICVPNPYLLKIKRDIPVDLIINRNKVIPSNAINLKSSNQVAMT